MKKFNYYVEFRHMEDEVAIQLFKLLLTESAADWLEICSGCHHVVSLEPT